MDLYQEPIHSNAPSPNTWYGIALSLDSLGSPPLKPVQGKTSWGMRLGNKPMLRDVLGPASPRAKYRLLKQAQIPVRSGLIVFFGGRPGARRPVRFEGKARPLP